MYNYVSVCKRVCVKLLQLHHTVWKSTKIDLALTLLRNLYLYFTYTLGFCISTCAREGDKTAKAKKIVHKTKHLIPHEHSQFNSHQTLVRWEVFFPWQLPSIPLLSPLVHLPFLLLPLPLYPHPFSSFSFLLSCPSSCCEASWAFWWLLHQDECTYTKTKSFLMSDFLMWLLKVKGMFFLYILVSDFIDICNTDICMNAQPLQDRAWQNWNN